MTVEDDLDDLYGVPPEDFMARRKDLAAAAKKRGDADGAKLIGAARRPTTAAWVVNLLVRSDPSARPRLAELAEALRTAHAAMDGALVRESTAAQRKLMSELVRSAFTTAGISTPPAALRDDVTDTLQAAIADPDVAARLGRLAKAERWSGFGDFGMSAAVGSTTRRKEPTPAPSAPPTADEQGAAIKRRDDARAQVDAAAAAHAESVELASDQRGKVAAARRRYEKVLETLNAAENEVNSADVALQTAEQRAREANDRWEAAKVKLAQAERALGDITA